MEISKEAVLDAATPLVEVLRGCCETVLKLEPVRASVLVVANTEEPPFVWEISLVAVVCPSA